MPSLPEITKTAIEAFEKEFWFVDTELGYDVPLTHKIPEIKDFLLQQIAIAYEAGFKAGYEQSTYDEAMNKNI